MGRVSAFLVRGACPATPPRPSPTARPLVKSGGGAFTSPTRPYADLMPGQYSARARVPFRGLPPGTYTACTWTGAQAKYAVSNPFAALGGSPPDAGLPRADTLYGVIGPTGSGRLVRITR